MARYYRGERALKVNKFMTFAPTETMLVEIEAIAHQHDLYKSEVIRREIEAGLKWADWTK